MNKRINILIVEPSAIIFEGLNVLLNTIGGFNVLAPVNQVTTLHERIITSKPQIILLNPTLLNEEEHISLNTFLQNRSNTTLIALIYQYIDPSLLHFYQNTLDIRESKNNIASILRESQTLVNPKSNENYELSDRETNVLILIANGLSSKEIADKLNISIHTVNSHRKNITHKTGIKSVAGLAVYAMLHNLVEK